MSDLVVLCPHCRTDYRIDSRMLGKHVRCGKCGEAFELALATGQDTRTGLVEARPSAATAGDFDLGEEETPPAEESSDSLSAWKVGEVLLGTYEVRPLSEDAPYAEGGMGYVHRVFHRGWNMDLAVKSPKVEAFSSEVGKQSFERECQTWIELGMHPNIVTCYLVRWLGGAPRVFAEFVEDGSLRDWIRSRRLYEGGPRESLRRILDVAIQFAWGLDYAHRRGVIHLDVKPANVMMCGNVAKVTDFGLARAQFAADARVGQRPRPSVAGASEEDSGVRWEGMTPAYCSPEQKLAAEQHKTGVSDADQVKLTRATDIWSWALSLLTMFHGKAPCRQGGHTAHQVFEIFLGRDAKDQGRPAIPEPLVEIMRRCFQVRPEDRPADLASVAEQVAEVYRRSFGEDYPRPKPTDTELTADSLNNRAASLLDLGKVAESRALLDQAWELRPWHPRVTFNRTMIAWRHGFTTDLDAIAHLQELVKTRPRDVTAQYAMALARMERGDIAAAVETLEAGIAAIRHDLEAASETASASETLLQEMSDALATAARYASRAPHCVAAMYAAEDVGTARGQPPTVFVDRDGTLLLFLGTEGMIEARQTDTGRARLAFSPPDARAGDVSLSTDLKWELRQVDGAAGRLEICEAASGRVAHQCYAAPWGRAAESRSDDGRLRLAIQKDRTIAVTPTAGDAPPVILRGHLAPIAAARFSADGRFIISGGSDRTVRIWETATGRCLRTLIGHTHPIDGVFLHPSGCWAVSVSGQRGLRLWNVALLCRDDRTRRAPLLLSHVTSVEEVERAQRRFSAVSAQARASAEGGDVSEALRLLRKLRTLPAHETLRRGVSSWRMAGQFSIRSDLLDACCVQTFDGDGGAVRAAALAPDARWFVSGGWDGRLRVWHASTGRCLRTFQGHNDWVRAVAVTPDQRAVLSAGWDRTLRLWDVATGQCTHVFTGHTKQIESIALGLQGRLAVSGGWDGAIRLWDLRARDAIRSVRAHDAYINAVAVSLDGRWIVSGSEDGRVRLWDMTDGAMLADLTGHEKAVTGVAIRADKQMAASASADGTIRLWSLAKKACVGVLQGHTSAVTALCFSPDGRWILSGSRDRSLRLWRVETGECCRAMAGHADRITCVSISDNGQWALSGSDDETVRLWELEWDYSFPGWTDWDEAARPHLEMFLAEHETDAFGQGKPAWTDADFEAFLTRLRYHGLGYVRPDGIHRALERMAADRSRPAK